MTKEEFKKLSDLTSQWYAENMANYLKEYDWDKFVMVADYSTQFGSTRNKYDLYKNDIKITPYINEKGEYKSNETESAKRIDEKYVAMGMSIVDLRTLTNEATKYNIWSFTLYPSGEYESNFIWDEEAHLESLYKSTKVWLRCWFDEASIRFVDKCDQLGIEWNFEVNIIISFTAGKSNPVLFIVPKHPEMNFKLHLDQLDDYIENDYTKAFEECSVTRVTDTYQASLVVANEETYHLMNEGELKDHFLRWNRATAILKPDKDISFEDIKFEWLPENEA